MGINGLRLLLFVAATVVWIVIMKIATSPLSSETIIQFEFAGTGLAANNMIASLQGSGQLELMVRSILLDCLFPLLYGGTLICATIWICGKLPKGNILNRPNIFIAAVVIAIIADLFEIYACLQ